MDAEQFQEHIWKFSQYGITLVAICFGNEVGLLDFIMEKKEPMTSVDIADGTGLKERYVREWLGCMVAAKVIQLDGDKYFIPEEHHGAIKGATAWGHGAVAWVHRFEQTKKCFRKNGPWGFDYSDEIFWRFFGGFREITGAGFLDADILPALREIPGLEDKLTAGVEALDVGCGSGEFTRALAQRYPKSTFLGRDICAQPLKTAEAHPDRKVLTNLKYEQGDAQCLNSDWTNKFDFVTVFDCLHDLPDPQKALTEIGRVIKPDGKVMIMDVRPHSTQAGNAGNILAAMFYSCSMFSCLQSSLLTEPRIGYGACWGEESMTKTIGEYLNLEKKVELPFLHALYFCSKKE